MRIYGGTARKAQQATSPRGGGKEPKGPLLGARHGLLFGSQTALSAYFALKWHKDIDAFYQIPSPVPQPSDTPRRGARGYKKLVEMGFETMLDDNAEE